MLHISYLFVFYVHNMQKLNKAALKCVIFWIMSVVGLFTYCYFDVELIIGIDILKLI